MYLTFKAQDSADVIKGFQEKLSIQSDSPTGCELYLPLYRENSGS